MAHLRMLTLLLSGAMGAAGCGPDIPTPAERGVRWGLATWEWSPVAPPEVRNASVEDYYGPAPQVVVNLLASGDVGFKGQIWPMADSPASARKETLDSLRSEIGTITGWARRRSPESERPRSMPLLVFADGRTPWTSVRSMLDLVRDPFFHLGFVRWPARPAVMSREVDCVVSTEVLSRTPTPSNDQALEVALVRRTEEGDTRPFAVHVGGRSWTLGPLHVADEPCRVVRDPVWDDVVSLLRRLPNHPSRATLEIEDPTGTLPWAVIASAVDALLSAGIRDVTLPDPGLRLQVREGTPFEPSALLKDEPVVTPGLVALLALAVLLAFLVTFAPWRRRRARRA